MNERPRLGCLRRRPTYHAGETEPALFASELYGRVHFSRSVYDEAVVEGMRQGYEDAGTLFAFLDQMNWLPEEVDLEDRSTPVSPVAEYHEQV